MRVLWAHMLTTELQPAKEALRDRERIIGQRWESKIGSWQQGQPAPAAIPDLPNWAAAHGLGPKFNKEEIPPSVEQVIDYLRGLTGTKRESAKEYIERAPRQIDTEYSRRIKVALGWSSKES